MPVRCDAPLGGGAKRFGGSVIPPVRCDAPWGEALRASGGRYFATGMVNSAPLAMLSGQRCITLL